MANESRNMIQDHARFEASSILTPDEGISAEDVTPCTKHLGRNSKHREEDMAKGKRNM